MQRMAWAGIVGLALVFSSAPIEGASITTIFGANNSQDGNMFDVNILGNNALVTSLDLNLVDLSQIAGISLYDVSFYINPGGVGADATNPAAWQLVGSVSGVSPNGLDNPTNVNFTDVLLSANTTYGFYVTVTNHPFDAGGGDFDGPMGYTNSTDPVGTVFVSNADLEVELGYGIHHPFGANLSTGGSGVFPMRLWNGTINYEVVPVPEPTTLLLLGTGLGLAIYRRRRQP